MLRILFLSLYDPCFHGGPNNHLRHLSENLSRIGCEVHILTYGRSTIDRVINGVHIHYLRNRLLGYPGQVLPFFLFSIRKIEDICRKYGINVVHGQSPSSSGYALFRNERLPLIVTLHGTSFGELLSYWKIPLPYFHWAIIPSMALTQPFWILLTAIEYKKADRLIAVSKSVANEAIRYYKLPRDKIRVIHNGIVPVDSFDSAEGSGLTVLSIGRLTWRKGFKYLIDAMVKIVSRYPEAKLVIVGDGEDRCFLERYVRKLKLERSVKSLREVGVHTLLDLYSRAMVYVQPSLYEPCSIAILEALSMGKPVVATRVGGTLEVVIDEITGLLVEPANSQQLANAIIRILSDSLLRERLSIEAKKRATSEFVWRKMAMETFDLYEDLQRAKSPI